MDGCSVRGMAERWEVVAVRGEHGPRSHVTKLLPLGSIDVVSQGSGGLPQDTLPLINNLGSDGWELVSVDREQAGDTRAWTYWLKRRIS